jgi:hypothetical protein
MRQTPDTGRELKTGAKTMVDPHGSLRGAPAVDFVYFQPARVLRR